MSLTWWGVIGTSLAVFGFKYIGHSIPRKYLEHPYAVRVNALIPVVLLSALVAVQTFTEKNKLIVDHRSAGLAVAILALVLKAPFPVVVICAALTSAGVYQMF